MHFTTALLFASTASALSFSDILSAKSLFTRALDSASGTLSSRDSTCPAVWTQISKALTTKFLTNGQCNPDARAAIRAVFHDCGAWQTSLGAKGGCDGSLILAGELSRSDNKGLQGISDYLKALAAQYSVGVADMIVFAGTHATVTCPGGPRIKTYIGRKDSTTPAPTGLLPDVNSPAANLSNMFKAKGFDDVDLAALIGAHTTSNQFNVNTSASVVGLPQDSTPGVWDVKFYSETLSPPKGVYVLASDTKLSQYGGVGKEFNGFVNNQGKWNGKFADAMARMTLFGSAGTSGMVDCTDVLPQSTNSKREMRALPVFARRY